MGFSLHSRRTAPSPSWPRLLETLVSSSAEPVLCQTMDLVGPASCPHWSIGPSQNSDCRACRYVDPNSNASIMSLLMIVVQFAKLGQAHSIDLHFRELWQTQATCRPLDIRPRVFPRLAQTSRQPKYPGPLSQIQDRCPLHSSTPLTCLSTCNFSFSLLL